MIRPRPVSDLAAVRRLALVLLSLAHGGRSKCGSGFGKYPLGIREALKQLRPLVPDDDPALPDLDAAIASFDERLSR